LLLLLVKGGVHYTCRINVASGQATLAIDGGQDAFVAVDGTRAQKAPTGQTRLRGRGTYRIRYSNVDAEIRLWVNEQRVAFDEVTTYVPFEELRPVTSATDPGDLAPLGIGTRDVALHVQRLRVLRDVYYVATDGGLAHEYLGQATETVRKVLQSPGRWPTTNLFDSQATFEITIGSDQLFPLGDNSPQSYDARMWKGYHGAQHFVPRELLIGKALLIYWPHPWYRPIPYLPNFKRMRLIH
jgi:signal peptidase I